MNTESSNPTTDADNTEVLPKLQATILLMSILVVALCGIVYELIIGTVSSYLLGNSVYQFSLTIGFFMFAMGVGSYISRFMSRPLSGLNLSSPLSGACVRSPSSFYSRQRLGFIKPPCLGSSLRLAFWWDLKSRS